MVLCLHQSNTYIERKLRVWRDQKCIPLLGAKTPVTCAGRQTTTSQRSQYRCGNGNLRKLEWTYRHGTMFAPRQHLYQKEDKGMERPEMYSPNRCKNRFYLCGAVKLHHLKRVGIRSITQSCVNWGGPTVMVPCLHQGNINIKRKLRVWRDQKYIPLVGAKTPLTCTGRQNTPSEGSRYRPENGNLRKLGWTYRDGTVFVPG